MPGFRDGSPGSHEELLRIGGPPKSRSHRPGIRTRRKDASQQIEAGHQVTPEKGRRFKSVLYFYDPLKKD